MKRSRWAHFATACVVCVAAFLSVMAARPRLTYRQGSLKIAGKYFSDIAGSREASRLPQVVLWAWERREDLRFLGPGKQGVAFLARTIQLRSLHAGNGATDSGIEMRPRLQPLIVAEGTPLMAVVRIESSNDLWHQGSHQGAQTASAPAVPLYTETQRERVAAMAVDAARLPRVEALQIDFDATEREQAFYGALLEDVRRRLLDGIDKERGAGWRFIEHTVSIAEFWVALELAARGRDPHRPLARAWPAPNPPLSLRTSGGWRLGVRWDRTASGKR